MASTTEKREIICEKGIITYLLTRKSVKNVNLRIKPDGRVLVSANRRVPISFIEKFIKEHQDYIFAALAAYREKEETKQDFAREYVSGEQYVLLGRSLELVVEESKKETVYSDGTHIFLQVKDKQDFRHKELMMLRWLREYQMSVFRQLVNEKYSALQKYGVPYPTLKVRSMVSRWGSCNHVKGIITLNSRLIEYPMDIIEYVVLHEFAHFLYPNHSKQFWDFVATMMPDWKERRRALRMAGFIL